MSDFIESIAVLKFQIFSGNLIAITADLASTVQLLMVDNEISDDVPSK